MEIFTLLETLEDILENSKGLPFTNKTMVDKEELLEISRICAKVPYEPAHSFREAIQSVWFIQLILQIESNGHSLSY